MQVVVKQLMQHINSNNLDNPHQSVYKTGHSTETVLLHIKNEIHTSLLPGEPTALFLFDLWATFDTIDHDTLLKCLKSWFGVCSTTLKWFSSYLCHRFQEIKIGQPSHNCMSCCLEYHKALSLALCFSLYTPLLSVRLFKGTPI